MKKLPWNLPGPSAASTMVGKLFALKRVGLKMEFEIFSLENSLGEKPLSHETLKTLIHPSFGKELTDFQRKAT